jgi:hypothetical protein
MVEALEGRDLNACLGVYQGLTYAASREQDGDHEGFEATRTELAAICGLSTRRMRRYIDLLVELRLLEVQEGGGSRPNIWQLVDPPLTLAPPDKTSGGTKRQGVPERQGDPGTVRQGATKGREETEETPPLSPPHHEEVKRFLRWLDAHFAITGHTAPPVGSKARESIMASWTARHREGWTEEQLLAAIVGAHGDDYRRENGYDTAESILRPTKIAALVNRGERRQKAERHRTPAEVRA